MLGRIGATIAGIVLIAYGLIAALSPLPAGAPLLIAGLLMIAAVNPRARPVVVRMRRRWPWFNRLVRVVGKRGPRAIVRVATETDPATTSTGERQSGEPRDG